MISRILSGIIAVGYLAFAFPEGAEAVFPMMFYVGPCLVCIWFSEEMGDCVGARFTTRESPGWAVAFCAWVLLLMPIFVCIYLGGW